MPKKEITQDYKGRMPFLQQVAADLLSSFGADLKDVAIVLPNKRPIIFLRKHLADQSGKPIWSPSFFTIQDFFAQSSCFPAANTLTQFFILHRLHNELLRSEGRPEERPDEFFPLAETILADFAQLDFDLVNPDDVYAELRDIALLQQRFQHLSVEQQQFMQQFWESFTAGKQTAIQQRFLQLWGRLPTLYSRFKEELTAQQRNTTAGSYRDLAEGRAANVDFLDNYLEVVFVGFNALNQCEATLFKQWQDMGIARFYFDADRYYVDDELQEAGYFLRKNINQYGLTNALGDLPAILDNKHTAIDLFSASGHAAQAKLLPQLLANRGDENHSPTQTAIVLADESLLIPVLQSLPGHLAFNMTMGYPLMQSTLFGFIDLWLAVQQQLAANGGKSVVHSDVEAALAHPLSGVSQNERLQLLDKIKTNDWLEVPVVELVFQTGSYPNFFKPQKSTETFLTALQQLLEGVLEIRQQTNTLTHLESTLILAAKQALNLLQDGLADHQLPITFLGMLIQRALQGISAPVEGEPLQGIQIMGLLESRCLDFDEIYIVGANEGMLPKVTAPQTFIPDSIRRAHGLPVLENQDALSAYLFYRLLQHPEKITLVYNNVVDERNTGEVSRFIRQLAFESNMNFLQHAQQQQIKTSVAPTSLIIAKEGEVWKKLLRYVDVDDPNRPRLSASALSTYLQSPLVFFLKYVAGLKEPPKITEEFEMNRLGSVVHEAMQNVYEHLSTRYTPIEANHIRQIAGQLPKICLRALSTVLYDAPDRLTQPNSMQRILLKIAEEYTAVFLHYDARNATPMRIVELENNEDYAIDFPLTVEGKTKMVRLYGIIDRVDEMAGKTRIVDYKTGRDELKFNGLETLFAPASDKSNKAMIQTLFYTYIYEQVTGKRGVEPNLYIARKLRTEGSLFYTAGRNRMVAEGAALADIKVAFVDFLRHVLEELFNPDIPFMHNPEAVLYPNDPYAAFMGQD